MVYCHECGSEISEVDTFCPFCGISLQPVIVKEDAAVEEADVSQNVSETVINNNSENIDDSADDIDMSETIVVNQPLDNDFGSNADSNEFIDINSLKNDDVSLIDTKSSIDSDNMSDTQTEPTENEKRSESELVEMTDTDISSNRKDIEELLSDEKSTEDDLDSYATENTQTPEEKNADEKAVKIVTETIEEIGKVDDSIDAAESVEQNESLRSDPPTPNILQNDSLGSTEMKLEEESQKAAKEIQETKDSDIENALSEIDSKANTLKKDDDVLTTDALLYQNDQSDSKDDIDLKGNKNEVENISEDKSTAFSEEVEVESTNINDEVKNDSAIAIESEAIKNVAKDEIESLEGINSQNEEVSETANEVSNESKLQEQISDSDAKEQFDTGEDKFETGESDQKMISQTTPNIGKVDTDGSSSQKLKPLDEGTLLNSRYEIVRKIGGGGMGAVYLANDKNLGGTLRAVKEMVQSYIGETQQEKAVDDFKRESELLASLDHPSIPTIYDFFYDDKEGRFYLVMKYISGGDLSARLRSTPEGKLDEYIVTDWAYQIADVLDYLHTRETPIVYRDLKPANIMIDGNTNKVMLIDFGIARWINKEQKGVTAVGTMGYAPPELFSGNVEPSSDIYSLGSTMFHLLTGADPQNNPLLIFDFQKHPRPRQINPQLSDQMERILMRAVEYNAEKRFSSAAEMKHYLKEHLESLKSGKVSYGVKATPASVSLADQPVFCGFCGQKIVATDMFCAFCGAKQPLAQPGVHSEEYNIPQITAKLIIQGTSELDFPSFELVKSENLVGRRDPMSNIFPEVDLSKFDPQTKISRKHARIWREADKYMIEDLGSSNGTYLMQALSEKIRLIPNQSKVLHNGDKIILGDTTLHFIAG